MNESINSKVEFTGNKNIYACVLAGTPLTPPPPTYMHRAREKISPNHWARI